MTGGGIEPKIIHRLKKTQPEVALPQPVHERFGEARIRGISDEGGREMESAIEAVRDGLRNSRLGKWRSGRHKNSPPLFTTDFFEILVIKKPRKGEKTLLWPFVIVEMLMATRAFHSRAQKYLADIRGSLQDFVVVGMTKETDLITDAENIHVPGLFKARKGGIEKFGHEEVVGLVGGETGLHPRQMIAPTDHSSEGRRQIAGKCIQPKNRPVSGVIFRASEEFVDQARPLIGLHRIQKSPRFPQSRHHSNDIEIDPPQKGRVIAENRFGGLWRML